MALFAIIGGRSLTELDARVKTVFQQKVFLHSGQWLVSYTASLPADVYQAMKNQGGDINCIVLPIHTYYGWYDKAVWDWMDAHRGV